MRLVPWKLNAIELFSVYNALRGNETKVSGWLVKEMMEITCTTSSCAVGLHQNVGNSLKVSRSLFIYNGNQIR